VPKSDRIRLHKFLVKNLKSLTDQDYTNPEIQNNIEEYGVIIDGILTQKRLEWVEPFQKVELNNWPERVKGDFSKIKTLKETDDYLIIFKPKNLVVQKGSGHTEDNLVNWLGQNFEEQKELLQKTDGNASSTAGLVHRIDKDTSGVLLVARSEGNLKFFQDQFRERKVQKKYLAVVKNLFSEKVEIENWQSRSKRNPIKQKFFWSEVEAKNYDENSRYAKSIITPIKVCKELNLSLIEVEIKTGRMHQIRLQCEALGYPLLNDKIYNGFKTERPNTINLKTTESCNLEELSLSKNDFQEMCKKIYDEKIIVNEDSGFYLLSNYLKFKDKNMKDIETKYKEF
jgi:23S rRNA pseudouridine1911/1915/1917 synthase